MISKFAADGAARAGGLRACRTGGGAGKHARRRAVRRRGRRHCRRRARRQQRCCGRRGARRCHGGRDRRPGRAAARRLPLLPERLLRAAGRRLMGRRFAALLPDGAIRSPRAIRSRGSSITTRRRPARATAPIIRAPAPLSAATVTSVPARRASIAWSDVWFPSPRMRGEEKGSSPAPDRLIGQPLELDGEGMEKRHLALRHQQAGDTGLGRNPPLRAGHAAPPEFAAGNPRDRTVQAAPSLRPPARSPCRQPLPSSAKRIQTPSGS